jgi:transposase
MSRYPSERRSSSHEAATVLLSPPGRGIPVDHRPASRRLGKALREHRPARALYQVEPSRAAGAGGPHRKGRPMNSTPSPEVQWQERRLFVGLDWAKDKHDFVGVDAVGRIVLQVTIEDTAEGWAALRDRLVRLAGPNLSAVPVAVETNNGPAVERLLEMGCQVFPMNPKAAQRYRDRKAPSGSANDRLDAWSFADGLRTDGHAWRDLKPEDALTQELRLLCRDEIHLIEQRTAWVNQLREALHEYYPAALEAFEDWVCPGAWTFVERFPTPEILRRKGRRCWESFLHAHRLYHPQTCQRRLEIFARADRFCGSPPVTRAKSRLAVALVRQLQVLEKQLHEYRAAIEELFRRHPDHDLFDSLPGAGAKLAPRLLSELGDDRDRFEDAQGLQSFAGTAPVCIQSGQSRWVKLRRACNKWLRAAIHLWANLSRAECLWAETYYQRKRKEGHSHATALRCLGQRWLKILLKMWRDHRRYDEPLHLRNMVKRGSWSLQLAPK